MWQVQLVIVTGNVELVWRGQIINLDAELYSSNEQDWKFCVGHKAGYDNEYHWQHHKEVRFKADGLSAAKLRAVSLIPDAQQRLIKIMDSKYKNFEGQLLPWVGKTPSPEDLYYHWDRRQEYRRPYFSVECRYRQKYTRLRLAVINNIITDRILNAEALLNDSHY